MKSLCLVKFSALGDLAQIERFLPSLAKSFKITLLTTPMGKAYFEDSPYIEKFIILTSKKLFDVIKLIPQFRVKFDYFVDLQGNDRSKFLSFFAKARCLGNYQRGFFMTNLEEAEKGYIAENSIIHRHTLSILRPLVCEFKFTHFHQRKQSYIVFHVGSSPIWASKRLPKEKWIEFSKIVTEKFGLPIVLTGGPDEMEYVQEIGSLLHGEIIIKAGKTTLQELKSLLREGYLTIATDSGPMHISASLGTPTIGMYGASYWVTQECNQWIHAAPFGPWSTKLLASNADQQDVKTTKDKKSVVNDFSMLDLKMALDNIDLYIGSGK